MKRLVGKPGDCYRWGADNEFILLCVSDKDVWRLGNKQGVGHSYLSDICLPHMEYLGHRIWDNIEDSWFVKTKSEPEERETGGTFDFEARPKPKLYIVREEVI